MHPIWPKQLLIRGTIHILAAHQYVFIQRYSVQVRVAIYIYIYIVYVLFFSNIFYTAYSDLHICIAYSFTQSNPVNICPITDNITQ